MNCPGCGAGMRFDASAAALLCDYCGNLHVSAPNDDGVQVFDRAAYPCPVCNPAPLSHAALDGQSILYCPRCRGMLVPIDIFVPLIEDLRSRRDAAAEIVYPLNPKDLTRHIRCPQCDKQVDTHAYGGGGNVAIGTCEKCGVNWLNGGALDRIVRAPDRTWYIPQPSEPRI